MAKDYAHMSHGELLAEVERLDNLINSPHTADFLEAVRLEAAHQAERWGTEHDAGKGPVDWLFLVSYLAGKAAAAASGAELPKKVVEKACAGMFVVPETFTDELHAAMVAELDEKALHHTITAAAACLNWHAALAGRPLNPLAPMRPGTEPPQPDGD